MSKESISGNSESIVLNPRDAFALLRERFTNPLIFSFFIAWIFCNWHATIALLGYQFNEYDSLYGATVYHILKFHTSWGWPIFFAILYTLFNPIIKNIIRVFYTYVNTKGETYNLLASKGGKVDINKYINLRKRVLERTKELETLIDEENKNVEKISELRLEKQEILKEHVKAKADFDNLKYKIDMAQNVSLLNGQWKNTYSNNSKQTIEYVSIENGIYYIVMENGFKEHKFDIIHYYFEDSKNTVFFIKRLNDSWVKRTKSNGERLMYINELRFSDDQRQYLSGIENGDTNIVYERVMTTTNDEGKNN